MAFQVAGASIGCLLLGVAIGVIGHIYHQTRKVSSYSTHTNELVEDGNL
jgi:hypothetical protein